MNSIAPKLRDIRCPNGNRLIANHWLDYYAPSGSQDVLVRLSGSQILQQLSRVTGIPFPRSINRIRFRPRDASLLSIYFHTITTTRATFVSSFLYPIHFLCLCIFIPTLTPGMQPASGSEFYPARDARTPLTRGFLLGHRHRTQANEQLSPVPSLLNPHNPPASRGTSSHSRRKRSTETALLTDQDGGGKAQQENKRIRASCCHPIHSLQSSTTRSELRTAPKTGDIDLITLRVKVRQFSATARSATGACTASTSAFVPACCSGKSFSSHKSRSTSVFKPLHSTNVTSPFEDNSGGRSSTSASTLPSRSRSRIKFRAVKPGKSKGSETNNSDTASPFSPFPSSSSSPARSPSSFDVGRANTVTCTTPTRDRLDSFFDLSPSSSFQFPSFDALDDLTRWGMDTMTYLSTAPNNDLSNVEQTTTTNSISNSKNPPFSNPFSTPFGDDDYLENEIPFPSTRPRVVLEPMGVKKSKTLAADKARNLAATCAGLASHSRSRYLHPFIPYELPRPAPVLKNPSIPQSPSRPPPVLPHPLPPLQSGETPSPLSEDSLARTSSYLQRLVEPSQSSFPSATTDSRNVSELDANRPSSSPGTFSPSNQSPNSQSSSSPSGPPSALEIENEEPRVTLGGSLQRKLTPLFTPPNGKDSLRPRLEDFELSVMFPQTAHYEVWDMSDQ